jgi:CDGSH-type Zn-finger protein
MEGIVKGHIAQKSPAAVAVEAGKTYHWCACGQSKNQPLCDGSHKGSAFTPLAFTPAKSETVYLCQCKQTNNAPFCDGSHKAL